MILRLHHPLVFKKAREKVFETFSKTLRQLHGSVPQGGRRQLGLLLQLKANLSDRLSPRPARRQMTDSAGGRVPPEEEPTPPTISGPFESQVQMQSSREGDDNACTSAWSGNSAGHWCSRGQILDLCCSDVSGAAAKEVKKGGGGGSYLCEECTVVVQKPASEFLYG